MKLHSKLCVLYTNKKSLFAFPFPSHRCPSLSKTIIDKRVVNPLSLIRDRDDFLTWRDGSPNLLRGITKKWNSTAENTKNYLKQKSSKMLVALFGGMINNPHFKGRSITKIEECPKYNTNIPTVYQVCPKYVPIIRQHWCICRSILHTHCSKSLVNHFNDDLRSDQSPMRWDKFGISTRLFSVIYSFWWWWWWWSRLSLNYFCGRPSQSPMLTPNSIQTTHHFTCCSIRRNIFTTDD